MARRRHIHRYFQHTAGSTSLEPDLGLSHSTPESIILPDQAGCSACMQAQDEHS